MHTPPPCMPCRHCCQVLPRFLDQFVRPVFCHFCSKLGVVLSFAQIYFKHHLLSFFSQNIPPPGIMDCCLPCDRSAAHSTQWQDLELTFHNTAREKGKGCVCVSETSGSVDARVSETHVSRTFPCTKRRKQSSVECCRPLKVIPIRRRSPFPYQTDRQNAVCATYIHANSTWRNFRTQKR